MHISQLVRIMPQTKQPPTKRNQQKQVSSIKWNQYKIGETQAQIMKELNQLVAKKEYRRNVGLEVGVFREFKGNTHWNLYLTIQLAEIISKRMHNDLKTLFLQLTQGINYSNTFLNNILQQLKNTEYNINNATTISSNNTIKSIRAQISKLNSLSEQITKVGKDFNSKTRAVNEELNNVSESLKTALSEGVQVILTELGTRADSEQAIITSEILGLKDFTNEKLNELIEQSTTSSENNVNAIQDISTQFSDKISKLGTEVKSLEKHMTTLHEATNNVLDDQQGAIIVEFQEGLGGVIKQNLDTHNKIIESETNSANSVMTRIDENAENLTSLFDATNEHIEKIHENINISLKNMEDEYNNELKTEITDVRSILSIIRSDIELMKSVLTKLDSKS